MGLVGVSLVLGGLLAVLLVACRCVCCPIYRLARQWYTRARRWFLAALAVYIAYLVRLAGRPASWAFPFIPEGPRLLKSVRRLPRRQLSGEELEAYARDGVLLLRGLVPDATLLEELLEATAYGIANGGISNVWLHISAIRTLIRDGPLASVVAQAMGAAELRLLMSQAWVRPAEKKLAADYWHNDMHSWHNEIETPGFETKYVTIWLALTNTSDVLEVIAGSHGARHSCEALGKYTTMVNQSCITHDFAQNVSALGGGLGLRRYGVSAGDALVFHGKLWHRGFRPTDFRLAICVRFTLAGDKYAGQITQDNGLAMWQRQAPLECGGLGGPLFPVVYPRTASTMEEEEWPLIPTYMDVALGIVRTALYKEFVFFRKCEGLA